MDGVEACPWGLLSLAGALAVLVVAPSQCVEAAGACPAVGRDHPPGGGSTLPLVLKGCRWLEAMLALGAVGLGVAGVVWSAMHGGGGCLWLHLVSRLVASILLLLPSVATLAWGQTMPWRSAWGPYALYGMAMLLVAGVGRLYAEKDNGAWAQRDPGLLLEASLLGTLALLAVAKAGTTAAATLAVSPSEDARRSSKRDLRWWARRRPPPAASDGLEAPLLAPETGGAHAEKDGTTAKSARPAAPAAPAAPIDRAGVWSRLVFGWVGPLLRTGAKRQLGFDDVPALGREDETEAWARRFDAALEAERGRSNPSLLRAAHAVFAADVYAFAGLQLINDLLGFSGPVLLKLVVNYVQDFTAGTATLARGYTILLVLLLTYVLTAVLSTQYNLRMSRLQLRVRTALVTAIYAQLLRCRAPQLGGLGSGEVTNLISLDTQRVQDAASSFNSGWSLPVQVSLTLYLLYREVSYAFVAGLVIMALMVPLNTAIANAITRVTQEQMRFKDQRVQLCDEMLHGIRTLKMLAWEGHLAAALNRLRREEMRCLARRKYLDALCVIFWAATPVLTSLATFVAVVYIDHDITPAAVFTTIALLQMLTFPLNAFPWILNGLMEARVSKRRLQRFLLDLPSPPNYVIRAEATPSKTSPGLQSSSPKKRRTPTIEGIFRNTGLATGAVGGPFCLEVYGSFAWEEPPLAPPSLPPTPGRDDDDEDVDPKLGGIAQQLPERVVGLEELEGAAEGILLPADASSDGGKADKEAESKGHVGPSEHQQPPSRGFMVRDLALRVRRGETVGVYGRIGAGKSSLLAAVLGEMYAVPARAGAPASRVVMRAARVAYVAQSPWLQRGSIRDNIVFGHPWDPARFEAVVAACGLCPDLAALPGGAETEVGERGGTLSGGQRLRVALARALYSRAELYLLDDIFSGLDGRTAAHVAREAVHGMMRREGATVLLVTHALPLLAGCDWAVAMRGGAVVERIRVRQQEKGEGKVRAAPEPRAPPAQKEDAGSVKERGDTEAALATTTTAATTALATEETRQIGKVRWGVYGYYVASAGRLLSFVTVLSLLAMQLSSNAMSLWLSIWSAHTDRYSASQFLAISGTIAAANAGFTILRSFLFAWGGLRAARRLHDRLLAAVLAAALKFFEANPVGRILNRFAGDTWTVDDSLPFILNILLAQSAALVGTTVVLGLASPWTLLVLLLVSPLYYRLQAFYRASSRELKRLDSVARSPLLAHFSETMAGAQTVRAFGATDRFRAHSLALGDANQRVGFYSSAASQWLGLRVQAFGVVVVASVAAWAVGSCAAHRPARAELIGLALSYASGVLGNLGGILNSYAETEREMVAVERVHEFTEEPPERDIVEAPAAEVAPDWPWAGAVRVEGLCLRYRPGWPLALDHVSLRIRSGEKVAVCGRTGSGKSSLLACLFRLVPWEEGSIVVDGAPIDRVPLRRLRSALSIIPQEPVAFGGTVRSNVDPQGEFDDAELFRALQACHLDVVLREHHRHQHGPVASGAPPPSLAECLDMEVKEKGLNFSVGQRQLLCLCRALLRRARVVCVDEATASLDAATDALVRRTLASAFKDSTVITIAHRTSTVLELCTRVLVLSEGRLVEEGDPRQLLADPSSHLHALSKAEEERGPPTNEGTAVH